MTTSANEISAMQRAIVLSAFGLGRTSPNPPVGCVILDSAGQVVGEGYHERKGEAHAEVHALTAAGERARGGTAVVTLEPCNHHGRTPPCRQALIDAGIRRTVIAVIDPTSREEGGAERLRAAGVEVEVGLLSESARLVLRPWLHSLQLGRPYVTWLYEVDASGQVVAPADVLVAHHRVEADAVLDDTSRPTEGLPNGHGHTVFRLPAAVPAEDPATLLAQLHTGGARSVLITSPLAAQRFLRDGLVDHATVYATPAGPSASPVPTQATALSKFSIDRVGMFDRYVRIDASVAAHNR
ncbi:bifunctional diaminohydroxyphosphoribosylaminopyrimidine deaminase/5-amino-6-(5-phosphoribosylamino)uracil reductase RibD [Saccharothrix luteola]|uniref:bifunctional diaminohydroxyphosphoribosylaminopyrimidine deaminase/5-amino-6-(5-phosphoribosylamino)uracil reductase RibD n=1 Tax=Saccharothrix luteola TaxID=2893018 RepID=UPI001E3D3E8E|nr:bifunctional diaminohydroxyphosphoribosylaminopyrimidine deaminase/5-amino-6-(5-phosphoribosylamino)uracil reductase RibD [Saccharothrix luteola]MCC8245045.1 bifunctional diaminohydroxyphosphoribosylaminopyrimidine deaminase/5-amino-6-(5-phosphoribosylamino)uracil reductase RibD [Saccharothrix luteola]